jgi:hypothetical protein
MGTLLLSLLLIALIVIGMLMGKKVVERFEDAAAAAPPAPTISPALANLLAAPALAAAVSDQPVPQVPSKLERDKEIQDAVMKALKEYKPECPKPECPKCPTCPDMSQYIRMDEVPCWNCTLP